VFKDTISSRESEGYAVCKSGQDSLTNAWLETFQNLNSRDRSLLLATDCSFELLFVTEDGNSTIPETSTNTHIRIQDVISQEIEIFNIGIYRQNSVRLSNIKFYEGHLSLSFFVT
jgi:hypothetical protein